MAISFTLLDQAIDNLITHLAPPGEVRFFMRDTVPPGWLLWQNTKIYQNQYPRLYDVMKNLPRLTKGSDSGGAYVILPNIDNRVLQATTSVSNVGQLLEASLPNIAGMIPAIVYSKDDGTGSLFATDGGRYNDFVVTQITPTTVWQNTHLRLDASRSSSIHSGTSLQPSACLCQVAIRF